MSKRSSSPYTLCSYRCVCACTRVFLRVCVRVCVQMRVSTTLARTARGNMSADVDVDDLVSSIDYGEWARDSGTARNSSLEG